MYANIVSIQYKSAEDAEEAVKKMEANILPQIRKVPGFQRFHLVRTSETSTLHIGIFDTSQNAEHGRSNVYPYLRDAVSAHVASPPSVQHGPVRLAI